MKKLFFVLFAVVAFAFSANAESYTVDDSAIDALMVEAVDVASSLDAAVSSDMVKVSGRDPFTSTVVAFVLDTIGLGCFGIHRLILGTNGINCLWYTLTFGGIFGIVPLVDWIMLIIDIVQGTSSYIDNPAFIMWL